VKVYNFDGHTPQGRLSSAEQSFRLALDFHEAAIRAAEEVRNASRAPIAPLVPMVVNYAFAAELYLKCLYRGAACWGHNLRNLFVKLPVNVSDELAMRYLVCTGRPRAAMDQDLKALSTTFPVWRYVFEGEGQQVHVNLLVGLVQAAFETARHLEPAWSFHPYAEARFLAIQPHMTLKNLGGGLFVNVIDDTGTLNLPNA